MNLIGTPDYLTDFYHRQRAYEQTRSSRPLPPIPYVVDGVTGRVTPVKQAPAKPRTEAELAAEWGVAPEEVVDVALHEASHTMVAFLMGGTIRSIELHPGGGRTEFDSPDERVRALVAAAGYVAEPHRDECAYESDRAEVEAMGLRWEDAVKQVEAIYSWPGIVQATANLAGHLLHHRKMTGAQFEALLGRA